MLCFFSKDIVLWENNFKGHLFRRIFFLLLKCDSADIAYKYHSMR